MSDKRQTIEQPSQQGARVEVRGPESGHLYGRIDRERLILEVKRKGGCIEMIDLRPLLAGALLIPVDPS